METLKKKVGRRLVDDAFKKKNRAISLTDAEYQELNRQATDAGFPGPSAYIVKKLKLS